jgi:ankyrin repeat protein
LKGADVNATLVNKMTPLHIAAYKGHQDVVELLISKGADVNAVNEGHNEIEELLIKHGGHK